MMLAFAILNGSKLIGIQKILLKEDRDIPRALSKIKYTLSGEVTCTIAKDK